MDQTAVLVAVISFCAAVFTSVIGAFAMVWVNHSEKRKAAEASAEAVLRERILLKDEIIQDLREDKAELMLEVANLSAELDRLRMALEEGRAEERERIDGSH